MTKEEVVKQCNIIVDKLEDLMQNVEELVKEIRSITRAAEYLPSEASDINNEEE